MNLSIVKARYTTIQNITMDVAVLQQFAIGQPVFLQNKNSVI
jgi:hypothetical protein